MPPSTRHRRRSSTASTISGSISAVAATVSGAGGRRGWRRSGRLSTALAGQCGAFPGLDPLDEHGQRRVLRQLLELLPGDGRITTEKKSRRLRRCCARTRRSRRASSAPSEPGSRSEVTLAASGHRGVDGDHDRLKTRVHRRASTSSAPETAWSGRRRAGTSAARQVPPRRPVSVRRGERRQDHDRPGVRGGARHPRLAVGVSHPLSAVGATRTGEASSVPRTVVAVDTRRQRGRGVAGAGATRPRRPGAACARPRRRPRSSRAGSGSSRFGGQALVVRHVDSRLRHRAHAIQMVRSYTQCMASARQIQRRRRPRSRRRARRRPDDDQDRDRPTSRPRWTRSRRVRRRRR